MRQMLATLMVMGVLWAAVRGATASTIAYQVTAGTVGNQDPGGGESLGMDFDVNAPIVVTQLGVFDSGSGALVHSLTAQLYDRDTELPVTPLITFAAGSGPASGTLIGGSLFLPITPITLPAGFHGTIVASLWDSAQPNYNSGGGPNPTETTDSGGGLISFVDDSRASVFVPDVFPTRLFPGPANRFDAGTFQFQSVPNPRPGRSWASARLL